jgi:hypothetical protein
MASAARAVLPFRAGQRGDADSRSCADSRFIPCADGPAFVLGLRTMVRSPESKCGIEGPRVSADWFGSCALKSAAGKPA